MESQVNVWFSMNAEKFRPEDVLVIKMKLEKMDANQFMIVQSASFVKPSTIFLIAILLGWERFWLEDTVLGVLKVCTCYGCFLWWLIDIFSAKKRAKEYNFKKFTKMTMFI
jgi:hypothetical protein